MENGFASEWLKVNRNHLFIFQWDHFYDFTASYAFANGLYGIDFSCCLVAGLMAMRPPR